MYSFYVLSGSGSNPSKKTDPDPQTWFVFLQGLFSSYCNKKESKIFSRPRIVEMQGFPSIVLASASVLEFCIVPN